MISSKLRTLRRWYGALSGPVSLARAFRLYKAGRHADPATAPITTLRARGLDLDLHCRAGTSDVLVFFELFVSGEYAYARGLVPPPVRWVLDLGGNVGFATAYLHRMWPEARFVVVEPDPCNFATANKTLNPLVRAGKAHLHRAFVGARPRVARIGHGGAGGSNELRIDEGPAEATTTAAPDATAANTATVTTVPTLLETHGIDRVDFLKCDVEGAEGEMFDDCGPWIDRVRAMAVELHDGRTPQWLLERVNGHGPRFELLKVDESLPGQVCLAWLRRAD